MEADCLLGSARQMASFWFSPAHQSAEKISTLEMVELCMR
jgi:hypothetical protein